MWDWSIVWQEFLARKVVSVEVVTINSSQKETKMKVKFRNFIYERFLEKAFRKTCMADIAWDGAVLGNARGFSSAQTSPALSTPSTTTYTRFPTSLALIAFIHLSDQSHIHLFCVQPKLTAMCTSPVTMKKHIKQHTWSGATLTILSKKESFTAQELERTDTSGEISFSTIVGNSPDIFKPWKLAKHTLMIRSASIGYHRCLSLLPDKKGHT